MDERVTRRLRDTILAQLGLGTPLLLSLACTSNNSGGDDDGGVTTNPGSGAENFEGEGEGEASSDDSDPDGDGDGDELPKLDVPSIPKPCSSSWYFWPEEIPPEFSSCELGPVPEGVNPVYQQVCIPLPEDGSCKEICADGLCEDMQACMDGLVWAVCGPIEIGDECCVMVGTEQLPPVGRPFVVAGRPRLARAASLHDHLAKHWLDTARGEHASIAAFARFVATLLRFGAPASLVADALAAARDEARHTLDALALASRFAGRPLALGEIAIDDAMLDSDDLAVAVHQAVVEGCVAETLAAHEAACLAARATDPEVAAVLGRIAADEARHATLAWRFVGWALDTRPALRGVVERASRVEPSEPTQGEPSSSSIGAPDLLGFGCPSASLRARWRELGLRELIRPCAAALLSSRTAPGRSTVTASGLALPSPR